MLILKNRYLWANLIHFCSWDLAAKGDAKCIYWWWFDGARYILEIKPILPKRLKLLCLALWHSIIMDRYLQVIWTV